MQLDAVTGSVRYGETTIHTVQPGTSLAEIDLTAPCATINLSREASFDDYIKILMLLFVSSKSGTRSRRMDW